MPDFSNLFQKFIPSILRRRSEIKIIAKLERSAAEKVLKMKIERIGRLQNPENINKSFKAAQNTYQKTIKFIDINEQRQLQELSKAIRKLKIKLALGSISSTLLVVAGIIGYRSKQKKIEFLEKSKDFCKRSRNPKRCLEIIDHRIRILRSK